MHFKNTKVLVRLPSQSSGTCQRMCMYLETGWLRSYLATRASIWDKHARTAVFNIFVWPFPRQFQTKLGLKQEMVLSQRIDQSHGLILTNQSWKSSGVARLRSLWLRDAGLHDSETIQLCYNSGSVLAILCYLKHCFWAFLSRWLETCLKFSA